MSTFKPYLEQNYEVLKSNCLKSGKLFEDDKFPANDTSLYRCRKFITSKISWRRPHEITKNPQFIVDFIEPNDLDQGQIGNCWMIASAACILNVPEYLKRVIPDGQTFEKNNYAGIFHFRFWIDGEWVDVVVDDRIPVNEYNEPVFCKNSVDKNEMFGPLLEKAYAKLNVCYEFLITGHPRDALLDFTGGISEYYNLTRCLPTTEKERFIDPNILWELMFKAASLKSLFSCDALVNSNQKMEQKVNNGLVLGHAYSIIQIYEILNVGGQFSKFRLATEKKPDASVKTIRLLKLRNPWGKIEAYKGPWCKGASEWKQVAPKIEQVLQPNTIDDGQFFMSFEDYYTFFNSMDTVHVDIDGLANDKLTNDIDLSWNLIQIRGEWISGKNAGGCDNDPKTFWTNPQYTFDIASNKEKCALIVSLLQTDTAQKRIKSNGTPQGIYEALGFYIFSIKPGSMPDSNGIYDKSGLIEVYGTRTFLYQKEITKRCELSPRKYVIIPCCFVKDKSAKYLLRIYIEGIEKVSNQNNNSNNIKSTDSNPNPLVNPNKQSNTPKLDTKPSPHPIPQPSNRDELYDSWYYNGMNQKDIEKLQIKAKQTTTSICLIM